ILLAQLQLRGFIRRYEAGGVRVIQVVNFGRHQRPHPKEPKSALPAAPGESGARPDVPRNAAAGADLFAAGCAESLTVSESEGPPNPPAEFEPVRPLEFLAEWGKYPAFVPARALVGQRLAHFQARARDP